MPTADFPPAEAAPPPPRTDIARWRELVARTLKDRPLSSLRSATRDGIPIEPLYLRRQDAEPLSGRGARPWIVVQGLDDPDPDRVNGRALAAIKGGATGLSLRLASPDRRGLPPHRGALQTALQGVDLAAIQVRIEPHPEGLKVAQWLKEMVALGGLAPELAPR